MSYERCQLGAVMPARRVRSRFRRGQAMMPANLVRDPRRAASNFYATRVRATDHWPAMYQPNLTMGDIDAMEFSLRPPKWLKKAAKGVGKTVLKVAKVAVPLAAAAIFAPAAVGLAVRGGIGVVKGAKILGKVGGAVFRKTSGVGAKPPVVTSVPPGVWGNITDALRKSQEEQARQRAASEAEAQRQAATAAVVDSMPTPGGGAPPYQYPMTSNGPQVSYGDGGGGGEAQATESTAAATPPLQAGGPALAIGAVVIGALLLSRKGRRS
jgi:hypothetical protein